MHDPMTVAWEIKLPFWSNHKAGKTPYRRFYTLATIWHVDPERGGSDDSCGWFRPRLNKDQLEIVKWLAHDEARYPWFMSLSAKTNSNPVECESYIRGAILLLARCLKNRGMLRRKVTVKQANEWACLLVHNSMDNIRGSLAWLSGYHGNNYHDDRPNTVEEDIWFREESAKSFFSCLMAYILREHRYWFEHPKYHIIHWRQRNNYTKSIGDESGPMMYAKKYWGIPLPVAGWKIQIHVVKAFQRWAFSRCCRCRKGFKWGYAPRTNSWNGTGPRWFRSEPDVYHLDCNRPSDPCGPYIAKSTDPGDPSCTS